MPESGCTQKQARYDFIADAKHQAGIKRIMTECNGCGQCNHIAAEQAQLHARPALGNTIAHGRHATRHLRGSAAGTGPCAQFFWVMFIRLMCREHVVICRYHADIGESGIANVWLIFTAGCHHMRQIRTRQTPACWRCANLRLHKRHITGTQLLATRNNALRNIRNNRIQAHDGLQNISIGRE